MSLTAGNTELKILEFEKKEQTLIKYYDTVPSVIQWQYNVWEYME